MDQLNTSQNWTALRKSILSSSSLSNHHPNYGIPLHSRPPFLHSTQWRCALAVYCVQETEIPYPSCSHYTTNSIRTLPLSYDTFSVSSGDTSPLLFRSSRCHLLGRKMDSRPKKMDWCSKKKSKKNFRKNAEVFFFASRSDNMAPAGICMIF